MLVETPFTSQQPLESVVVAFAVVEGCLVVVACAVVDGGFVVVGSAVVEGCFVVVGSAVVEGCFVVVAFAFAEGDCIYSFCSGCRCLRSCSFNSG